jgi:serine/threonine-protein kinase HipA
VTVARVKLWGRAIGAVSIEAEDAAAVFQYEPEFVSSAIQVAPIMMPLRTAPYRFPTLSPETFHRLPGLLADSLPDRFGQALIDTALARSGKSAADFDPVQRLCYVGARGMGALEYEPHHGPDTAPDEPLEIAELVEIASQVLTQREQLNVSFASTAREAALTQLLRVGTSAGGARAKAVIAWNPQTNEVRSGQVSVPAGFEHWLIKFDGVAGNRDKELDDPRGYGVIEYAYAFMARAAGLELSACRLLHENDRRHFMTRRFDRTPTGGKLHMQTLGALLHLDYNEPGSASYEQALQLVRRLGMPMDSLEQLFRRMVFNLVARNQDDHVKNIACLMDQAGTWSLAPAYDVTYSYNPSGRWTAQHQMSLGGKRDRFTAEDLRVCAKLVSMKRGRAEAIAREVDAVVARWPEFASEAGVDPQTSAKIAAAHRVGTLVD